MPQGNSFDLSDDLFGEDVVQFSQPLRKRRKSNDSPISHIASRLSNRLPSLSRRWRDRSISSGLGSREIRSAASSRPASSRSSSFTSSVLLGCENSELFSTASAKNSSVNVAEPSSPIDIVHTEVDAEEPIDRKLNASTPLLPPMLMVRDDDDALVQSPLQSPTVADPNNTFSSANSPLATPSLAGVPSPLLSTKPSISSFHRSKIEKIIVASDIPPLTISDPNDEWSIKLGHANFVIYPEPYIPDVCDPQSCRQLFYDWEQARCNFIKHQVRTGEHFGVTSKTYQLTAEKWAGIDAQWKKNNDYAVAIAATRNHSDIPITPTEPAPVCQMPVLSDPKSEGKFPKLGDEDIVGPMVQIAARIQPKQSPKANFMKVLGDFSSIFFGPSSSGLRSSR